MSDELIDSYVDRGKFKSDTEFIEGELKRVNDQFDKLKAIKLNIQGANTLKSVATASQEGIKANTQLAESTKAVISLVKERFATEAKLVTLQTDYAKQTAANRLEIQKQTKELKDQAEAQAANTGSIERARAQVKLLNTERNKLNLFTEEGRARQKELNAQIDKYNAFIKKNVDSLSQQKINIGNYSGAISVLKTSLDEVVRKMDAQNKAGKGNSDVMKALEKEYAILNQLVNSQAAGFASASAEVKENQKALLQMEQAGLRGTDAFNKLALATGQLKDDIADLKARTKQLGSDTFVFDGLIQSAQTLAGVYGAAQGAAALFGQENEEVQKTLTKLAAVMTIIQSLQAISNAIQKESAMMLLLQQARTKALLAIETIRNFVMKGTTRAVVENTAAVEANTVATVATTTATSAATVAARVFRTALIATGIGAILVLLASAASAMSNLSDSTKDATLSIEDITQALQDETTAIDESISAIDRKVEKQKLLNRLKFSGDALKEADNISEVNGLLEQQDIKYQSLQKRLAERARLEGILNGLIAQQNSIASNNIADPLNFISSKKLDDQISKIREGLSILNKQIIEDSKASIKISEDTTAKALSIKGDEAQEKFKIEAEAAKKRAEQAKKDAEDAKKRAEELAKREREAQLEILRLGIEDRKNINANIFNDETKSLTDRLKALAEFSKASQELIDFDKKKVTEDPTKGPKEKALAEQKAAIDARNVKIEAERQYNAIVKKYFDDRKEESDKEIENFKRNEEKKREIVRNLITDKADSAELALRQQFEIDSANATAEKKKELEEKLAKDIDIIRGKSHLLQLQNDEKELQAKRVLLTLFKQSTAEIDRLITQNQIEQSKVRVENNKNENEEKTDDSKKYLDTIVTIENEAVGLLTSLIDSDTTRKKNALQDEIDLVEKKKNAEIEAINASLASNEEKAAKIAVVNAVAQAKKEALEQKQRKLDMQRAKFEKELGILQIIVQIGVAIAKQQYAAAALAAVALVKAVATPLPKFKEGKNIGNAYEGMAIINDGGKNEPHYHAATGAITLNTGAPKDTLTWVGRDDIIWPSVGAMMKGLSMPKVATMPGHHGNDNKEIVWHLNKQTSMLSKIADKRELTLSSTDRGMVALWKHGANTVKYINEQTNWNA